MKRQMDCWFPACGILLVTGIKDCLCRSYMQIRAPRSLLTFSAKKGRHGGSGAFFTLFLWIVCE